MAAGVFVVAAPASAGGSHTAPGTFEAEAGLPETGWTLLTGHAPASGGSMAGSTTANAPYSHTVTIPTGKVGIIRLYTWCETDARTRRYRIDGGAWTTLNDNDCGSGAIKLSQSFLNVAAGTHTVEAEYVSGSTFWLDKITTTTTPWANGDHARCNVNTKHANATQAVDNQWWLSCRVPEALTSNSTGVRISFKPQTQSYGVTNTIAFGSTVAGGTVQTNTGTLYQANTGATSVPSGAGTGEWLVPAMDCYFSAGTVPCSVETQTVGATYPSYPSDPENAATRDGEVPNIECARSMEDQGNGRYLVTLTGLGPYNAPGSGATDTYQWSTTAAGVTLAAGKTAQFLTPEGGTPPWSATFLVTRTFTERHAHVEEVDEAPDTSRLNYNPGDNNIFGWLPTATKEKLEAFENDVDEAVRNFGSNVASLFGWRAKKADGTYANGGDFDALDTVEITTYEARCSVLIYPARPDVGAGESITTNIYQDSPDEEEPEPTPTEEEADCGSFSVKWSLNPLKTIKSVVSALARQLICALASMFGPPDLDWADIADGASAKFPFSVGSEIGGAVGPIVSEMNDTTNHGAQCPEVDFGSSLNAWDSKNVYEGTGVEALKVKLPTPVTSGCASVTPDGRTDEENTLTDLFGFRTLLRSMLLVLLVVGFLQKCYRAFVPAAGGMDLETTAVR